MIYIVICANGQPHRDLLYLGDSRPPRRTLLAHESNDDAVAAARMEDELIEEDKRFAALCKRGPLRAYCGPHHTAVYAQVKLEVEQKGGEQ